MACACKLLPWSDPAKVRTHQRACAVMAKVHNIQLIDGSKRYPWAPDRRGHVRWLGMTWIGVPYPIRLALAKDLTGPLDGCGCNRRALVWWRLVKRSVARTFGTPRNQQRHGPRLPHH
jgi:hypothetical protein